MGKQNITYKPAELRNIIVLNEGYIKLDFGKKQYKVVDVESYINTNDANNQTGLSVVEKTSTYSVLKGEMVWADGTFTISFPEPLLNSQVGITVVGTSGTITADGNGNAIDGVDTTFDMISGESLIWTANGTKWVAG